MNYQFTLIGLPGVGKSTTVQKCAELLRSRGIACDIKSTDDIIKKRFKPGDPVIKQFEAAKGIRIPPEVFAMEKPSSGFILEFGEEPLYRDLEEMFVADIMRNAESADTLFDLGGKAPLRTGVIDSLRARRIIPIFLYAEHETIVARLRLDDNWKKRGNYLITGALGWESLARQHREERLTRYINNALIVISVDALTPAQLTREIFYRIAELNLVCSERANAFTNKSKPFLRLAIF